MTRDNPYTTPLHSDSSRFNGLDRARLSWLRNIRVRLRRQTVQGSSSHRKSFTDNGAEGALSAAEVPATPQSRHFLTLTVHRTPNPHPRQTDKSPISYAPTSPPYPLTPTPDASPMRHHPPMTPPPHPLTAHNRLTTPVPLLRSTQDLQRPQPSPERVRIHIRRIVPERHHPQRRMPRDIRPAAAQCGARRGCRPSTRR